MQFKDIVGQEDIINRLTSVIDSGHVSHAQLILGDEPDGSGKFITAFFRNAAIREGVTELLENRDGLMCGICTSRRSSSWVWCPTARSVTPMTPAPP